MKTIKKMPCDKTIDSSIFFLLEGYPFIQNRCFKHKSDIFKTRLLGKTAICMSGQKAAKIFYNNDYFERKGVLPKIVETTLMGKNGVQGLDGIAHQVRKEMFMSIMTPENLRLLNYYTLKQWEINSTNWTNKDIVLFDEAQIIMCQVAYKWAGIPLQENEIKQRATDLGKMIDGFGSVGPRFWQGYCARKDSEKSIRKIITDIRSHKLNPLKNTAAYIIAWHLDQNGKMLNTKVAAVELLNILRPIVAISTYITFGALAMYEHPQYRRKYILNENNYQQMFVQEVRRFYPFTPCVGARVKKNFIWNHYYMKKGTLVLLDVYGMSHDSRLWKSPYTFNPDRFINWKDNSYNFVPQGGGSYSDGHRCAGEFVTIEVMKTSLNFIATELLYQVKRQNLHYCISRIPTLPKSKFVMSNVRRLLK